MKAFDKNLMDHIGVYGPDNDKRLTGNTRPLRGTSFPTVWLIAARRSAFRTPS